MLIETKQVNYHQINIVEATEHTGFSINLDMSETFDTGL